MKSAKYVIFILSFIFLVVPVSVEANAYITKNIVHDNIERSYHIYLPKGFTKSWSRALVIALHGGGGTGKHFAEATDDGNFIKFSDKYGFVTVFPEGVNRQWNDGRKEIFRGFNKQKPSYDDVNFISRIIDEMVEKYNIDSDRVFVTGISNGGFMSFRLALELSDKIRAAAPVTAQISLALKDVEPSRPISLMLINGTKDPLVPYRGGHVRIVTIGRSRGEILSTDETIEKFVLYNECTKRPKINQLKDVDPNDGTNVNIIKYEECSNGTKVTLVKVIGGGHTWPGGVQYLPARRVGVVSREINATEMIVDFFLQYK